MVHRVMWGQALSCWSKTSWMCLCGRRHARSFCSVCMYTSELMVVPLGMISTRITPPWPKKQLPWPYPQKMQLQFTWRAHMMPLCLCLFVSGLKWCNHISSPTMMHAKNSSPSSSDRTKSSAQMLMYFSLCLSFVIGDTQSRPLSSQTHSIFCIHLLPQRPLGATVPCLSVKMMVFTFSVLASVCADCGLPLWVWSWRLACAASTDIC
jgi:hypothetical protein